MATSTTAIGQRAAQHQRGPRDGPQEHRESPRDTRLPGEALPLQRALRGGGRGQGDVEHRTPWFLPPPRPAPRTVFPRLGHTDHPTTAPRRLAPPIPGTPHSGHLSVPGRFRERLSSGPAAPRAAPAARRRVCGSRPPHPRADRESGGRTGVNPPDERGRVRYALSHLPPWCNGQHPPWILDPVVKVQILAGEPTTHTARWPVDTVRTIRSPTPRDARPGRHGRTTRSARRTRSGPALFRRPRARPSRHTANPPVSCGMHPPPRSRRAHP